MTVSVADIGDYSVCSCFNLFQSFRAYDNLERGTIEVASEFLMDATINRSPSSYLLNPQSERDEYASQGDTDKTMLMLKFISGQEKPLGALNWFAVHGTSMNNTNQVG
jgi:neutral ceramidase